MASAVVVLGGRFAGLVGRGRADRDLHRTKRTEWWTHHQTGFGNCGGGLRFCGGHTRLQFPARSPFSQRAHGAGPGSVFNLPTRALLHVCGEGVGAKRGPRHFVHYRAGAAHLDGGADDNVHRPDQ